MRKKKSKNQSGFTLVELMIATVLGLIVISGTAMVLADSQRGWNKMYNQIYADIIDDSYVARKTFDSVIRNASREFFTLSSDGSWLEVYYYADSSSATVDRYARFYSLAQSGSVKLFLEEGLLSPTQTLTTRKVCDNVSSCIFKRAGLSAQMILTLDDGSETISIVSSAVLHNQ